VAEVKPPAAVSGSTDLTDDQLWPRVLEAAQRSVPDRQRTEHLVFESFDGRTVKLSLDESGADVARYLSMNTDKIADLVKRATGRTVRIELDTSRFDGPSNGQPHADAETSGPRPPLVEKAMDLFDAEIIAVDDLSQPR
jgi:hypothetical protein